MISVQKRFNKCTRNVAYHAYQSFKTGEVSPELAHKIGVELASKMWKGHQVLVATHFNTGTYHNHFVVNSVNMFTGEKFDCNIGAYYRFRGLSDKLCAENNLSVIKNPKGRTPRNIYFAEKRGEPTKYNLMRQALDDAMKKCVSIEQFTKLMFKKGYIISYDPNRKYETIRSKNDKKPVRMYHLGEKYLIENIRERLFQNPYYVQDEYFKIMKPKSVQKRRKTGKYNGYLKDIKNYKGLDILFIILMRLLGLYPKQRQKYVPFSPEMKRAIRKMKRYSNETRLVVSEKLKTINDVEDYILKTEKDIDDFIKARQKYRNKLRNCKDNEKIAEYKTKIGEFTKVLNNYRRNLKIAKQILEDVPEIKRTISIEKQMKNEELANDKNKNKNKERVRNSEKYRYY